MSKMRTLAITLWFPDKCLSCFFIFEKQPLFSSGLFWDWFLLDLRSFFGDRFRYKLMYYYFYHRSNLLKIIRFLREIECIEFECNEFVLVLVQIDLIHFDHSICISSTWIKTNTNPTVQLELKLIQKGILLVPMLYPRKRVCGIFW